MQSQTIGKISQRHTRGTPTTTGVPRTKEYATLFRGLQQRPNATMPLSAHEAAGTFLKDVHVATMLRYPVDRHINAARCILDDWASCEYPELPQEAFLNLYYYCDNWPNVTVKCRISLEERSSNKLKLWEVEEIVAMHYPDCEPLRTLLKRLDKAITALDAWI